MLEQPTLQTLLTNNKPPSDSIIWDVKRSLQEAEVELGGIEEQIRALQQRAEAIKPTIAQYHIILSPIRTVPDDVLCEIFTKTMELNEDDAITSRRERNVPPVLFTHVCQRWREVGISTPILWRKLSIILPALIHLENLSVRTPLLNDAISRQCSSLNQEAIRLRQWLKRAGALPLRLSIYQDLLYSPGTWHDDRQALDSELARKLTWIFEIISTYLPQCEHLHISLPDEHIYQLLSTHITPDKIACISYFRPNMTLRSSDVSQQRALKEMPLFTLLPSLRRLHISHSMTFLIPAEANSWLFTPEMRQRLTYITAEGFIVLSQAVLILEDCPCLAHLQLHIQEGSGFGANIGTTGPGAPLHAQIKEILALHLQVLKVNFYPNALHTVSEGWQTAPLQPTAHICKITAPRLKVLAYTVQRNFDAFDVDTSTNPALNFSAQLPLDHILRSAEGLQDLVISSRTAREKGFRSTLHEAGSYLTHLCIGSDSENDPPYKFQDYVENGYHLTSESDAAFQHLFPLPEWSKRSSFSFPVPLKQIEVLDTDELDSSLEDHFCPGVEDMSLRGLQAIQAPSLLAFVVYRLRLYEYARYKWRGEKEQGIRPLKSLTAGILGKSEGVDISEAVHKLAAVVGVQFKLNLKYANVAQY